MYWQQAAKYDPASFPWLGYGLDPLSVVPIIRVIIPRGRCLRRGLDAARDCSVLLPIINVLLVLGRL